MNRSPSGTNIYRHTPPKELPQQQQQFMHHNNGNSASDKDFVVHKSKGITTMFNMDPLIPAKLRQAKEKTNNDSKADERGENERFSEMQIFESPAIYFLCFDLIHAIFFSVFTIVLFTHHFLSQIIIGSSR